MTLNYYEYSVAETGVKYYFCIEQNSTTYDFPVYGNIFDPVTLNLIHEAEKPPSAEAPVPAVQQIVPQDPEPIPQSCPIKDRPVTINPADLAAMPRPDIEQSSKKHSHHHGKDEKKHKHSKKSRLGDKAKTLSAIESSDYIKAARAEAHQDIGGIEIKAEVLTAMDQAQEEPKPKPVAKVEVFDMDVLLKQIRQFKSQDFVKSHFNEHKTGWFFKRRTIPQKEMIQFSTTSIVAPLLKNIPPQLSKKAIQMFDCLLGYMELKATKGLKVNQLQSIVGICYQHDELRDECYFQLVKPTTENHNEDSLVKAWEAFLVIATLFPASRDSELFVQSHIANRMRELKGRAASLAELAFLRFEARCAKGKNAADPGFAIQPIIRSLETMSAFFGVSIQEVLWMQKHVKPGPDYPKNKKPVYFPNLPVPYILHAMAERLKAMGALDMEGLFRIPGNGKKVAAAQESANINVDHINTMALHDLGSLFKVYFAQLPIQLIPASMVNDFVTLSRTGGEEGANDQAILSLMYSSHRMTLMYLCGFLRECAAHSDRSKMGASNLAIVFAPNIISMPQDLSLGKDISAFSQKFLQRQIERLDVSSVYPLPPEAFE